VSTRSKTSRTGTGNGRRAQGRPEPRYLNRQLSWLEFNARVLQLARDERIPELERLRFVSIFSSNLDEFYMVRVAELLESAESGRPRPVQGELSVREALQRISARTAELVAEQSAILEDDVLPALAEHGIRIVTLPDCDEGERAELAAAFLGTIFPVLTPLAVGPGRPFPYISNLSLSLGVFVRDPETGSRRFARVKVPEVLPRFWEVGTHGGRYLPLEDLIAAHLGSLFPGMLIEEHAPFRVTRDADLEIDDDADDLLSAVESELRRRRFGDVVRLELCERMSLEMRDQLVRSLGVDPHQVYATNGLLDLADLAQIASLEIDELRYPPWTGVTQPRLQGEHGEVDIFAAMRDGDLLVHHPYDAFDTSYERFISQAVDDPDVLAIKHTIYRTSGDSPIVPNMIRAAEQGKQAVVLVELKARFDEERNIGWARALERAGVHVVYGFAGLKTHAKCALVVRREGRGIRRYAHIGTGNYHPRTARLYTDMGLFTCRPDVTADVADLFNYLTGFARLSRYRRLLVAPVDLREGILAEIARVRENHSGEAPGRIAMKLNNLVDRTVIDALYEASQAGVEIDLVVRSICCLRPGVPGLSETIRVSSLVGRFLEHDRLFVYGASSGTHYYLGSADLMPRNLDHRVEVVTPVDDPELQAEIQYALDTVMADTVSLWRQGPDGEWSRVMPAPGEEARSAQDELMAHALAVANQPVEELDAGDDLSSGERVVRRVVTRPGADLS
jgi:polyphosphate kinase